MKSKLALLLLPGLAACATAVPQGQPRVPVDRPPPVEVAPPPTRPQVPRPADRDPNAPRVMNLPGLEGVIGANASSLVSQFGEPRLDVREGDARKLQFSGDRCVLDVFLYPLRQGAEPSATYVDARRSSDGLDVDRAACVSALRR
ncbi:hypothetical protein [Qipengyuania sp. JC766]|uniref:hypothetical protein n=1 Tax=Qipengyuania sp. JC766 TaxID=3232139 RepID=UPI00345902D1